MGNDSDSLELLAVVAAVHHERVSQSLDDRAVGLAESLGGITTSGVRNVDGGSDLDVIAIEIVLLVCCPQLFRYSSPCVFFENQG